MNQENERWEVIWFRADHDDAYVYRVQPFNFDNSRGLIKVEGAVSNKEDLENRLKTAANSRGLACGADNRLVIDRQLWLSHNNHNVQFKDELHRELSAGLT